MQNIKIVKKSNERFTFSVKAPQNLGLSSSSFFQWNISLIRMVYCMNRNVKIREKGERGIKFRTITGIALRKRVSSSFSVWILERFEQWIRKREPLNPTLSVYPSLSTYLSIYMLTVSVLFVFALFASIMSLSTPLSLFSSSCAHTTPDKQRFSGGKAQLLKSPSYALDIANSVQRLCKWNDTGSDRADSIVYVYSLKICT